LREGGIAKRAAMFQPRTVNHVRSGFSKNYVSTDPVQTYNENLGGID
jgi:hypothetical protein